MKKNNNGYIYKYFNLKIFIVLVATLIILSNVAGATVYRWLPHSGATIADGVLSNWGSCGTNPTSSKLTLLTNDVSSDCSSGRITSGTSDPNPWIEMYFNTAYQENTLITGNWYYGRINTGGSTTTTYRFYLIYVFPNGTKVTLPGSGSVTSSGNTDQNYNVSLTGISGTIPKTAKLGIRITKSVTYTSRELYFGDTAGIGNVPSGYFSVTEISSGQKYDLSGYVMDGSNGGSISFATVETDTGLSTTSDYQGYYNFSNLYNNTYTITASYPEYTSNSTITTISGSNKTNVNISLYLAPKYLLSGYVKDQSTGAVISNATVTTLTDSEDLITTTDSSGYYSFLLPDGTFIITGNKTGYDDNYVIKTVSGGPVSNANITLPYFSTVEKIMVATNRYVILDDPIDDGKFNQTGFAKPPQTGWSTTNNRWNQSQTQIKGYALILDQQGNPVPNTNVTFTLTNWGRNDTETSPPITSDPNGLANFTFDMNGRNYYGNWNITANSSGKSSASGFIYNWWGCNSGTGCNENHGSSSPGSGSSSIQNSPYTLGRETVTNSPTQHTSGTTGTNIQSNNNCVGCHRSYGGTGGGQAFTGQPTKTADVHTTDTCSSCHNNSTVHRTDVKIKSCTDCHTRTDLSKTSTMSGSPLRSNYSGSAAASGHTPNSTIPCIICHGPMHNISKPDLTQRMIKNTDTESSHCTTCHTSYTKHNQSNIVSGGVNCTVCHSDDIHAMMIMGPAGTYVTYERNNPGSYGNCTGCHQNSTYFNTLRSQTKAGSYSGANPRLIRNPQLHSDAYEAGSRYGNYWWTQNQDGSCKYCHGKQMHYPVALGRPALFKGNNVVNSTIGSTTWCASCHYPNYPDFITMVNTFTQAQEGVPPSIIQGSIYWVKGKDHSTLGSFNDSKCNECHNDSNSYTRITPFMHGVYVGGGGPDCLSCHDIGSTGSVKHVNNSAMKLSMHANLNDQAVNLFGVSAENKKCWGCHQTGGTQPVNASMGDRYTFPYTCFDCHQNDEKPYPNINNASSVTNHIDEDTLITRIHAHNATCTTCHNNSVNLNIAAITDPRIISEKESVSHYGSSAALIETVEDPQGCVYCHLNTTNAAKWGQAHDPRSNPLQTHTETKNTQCYVCHLQSSTLPKSFHNESMFYAGNGKIIVATNRYVILDDDLATGAKAQSELGFRVPLRVYSYQNYWSGKNTRINATAMFIDRYGAPQTGSVVSFTLYQPNGSALTTVNSTTNAYGLANFSYDMNDKNYYGNWKIRASSNGLGANTTFIYNWWGCAFNSGPCNEDHGGENPGSRGTTTANSPYLSGRDPITSDSHHNVGGMNCTFCHQSYDGRPGGINPTSSSNPNHLNNPSDVHRNITCTNSNCHGSKSQHDSNQRINSCFNAACHSRIDISRKQTLNGSNIDTALSIYSNNPSSFNATYHTPNSTVPCIICHGPMHSITKADTTQRFIKNNDTEYNNCISCHQDYVRHNNSVNCPICHSDDIHTIKVLSKNATYITLNKHNPNPDRANCNNCHQNSSFLPALLSNPIAGNYTGRLSPIVKKPMNHSEDPLAGSLWSNEGYWINNTPISWCDYCHNNEVHAMSTLGKIKQFKGDNIVNSTIGGSSWCASCHWQGYANDSTNYSDMVGVFTRYNVQVPPEITGHSLYAPTTMPGYYNHTLASYSDQTCKPCHSQSLGANARMTEFMHNVRKGQSGGRNCTSCHYAGSTLAPNVDIVNMGLGAHANLSNWSQSTAGNVTNRKCWACHGTLNANGYANETDQPAGEHNQSMYKNPRKCTDCHNNTNPATNLRASQVVEHREGAPVILTNGTGCSLCHNNSLTSITESDGFGLSGSNVQNATASHYLKDANQFLMTTANHSNDCRWCHITNTNNSSWGTPFNPKNSTKYNHSDANVAQNSNCYACHGGLTSSVKLHNSGITKGAAGGVNCTSCHNIGGTAGKDIDISNMNNGAHANINNRSQYTGENITNQKCWACHGTLNANGFANESDQPPNEHNLTMYKNPRKCLDCHTNLQSVTNFGAPQVVEHREGALVISTNGTVCSLCHNNSLTTINENDGFGISGSNAQNATASHYLNDANINLMTPTNHSNDCRYCHILNNVSVIWGTPFNPKNSTKYAHSDANVAQNSNCYACHGGLTSSVKLHNSGITKGASGGVNCTSCHNIGGTAGKDIDISNMNNGAHANINNRSQYTGENITNQKCWACHGTLNSNGFANESDQPPNEHNLTMYKNPRKCSSCHTNLQSVTNFSAPQVVEHREGALVISTNGTVCSLCHNNSLTTINENDGFGISGSNAQNATASHYLNDANINLMTPTNQSNDCRYCHILNNVSVIWGTPFNPKNSTKYAHSDANVAQNSNCYACHGGLTSSVKLHNSGISGGADGAPDCISCHYIGSQYPNIDVNAANISVHFGMNSFNATSKGYAPVVGACWACHDTDGNVTSGHPDKKDTPKVCDDCHVSGGAYYSQSVGWGGLTVTEHFKGGTDIKAGNSSSNIASCINCHENVSEMILSNNDIDTGSFEGDGMRLNGGNMSYYHYGRSRNDLRGVDIYSNPITNCTYCHRNASTGFAGAMLNPDQNNSINEHSDSTNPTCYSCHMTGWIHNSTLGKPIISNNYYCAGTCHSSKTSHNRTEFYCWYCHQNPNNPNKTNQKAPHGMMYPQTDGSFLMYNESASNANCTTCHVDDLVNTTLKPTRIPKLNHSTDPYSGKKWGNYWDNTSMLTACKYCHQSLLHLSLNSLMGNISLIKGTNTYKNSDLTNSTWCANCHYAGASRYNGNILNPVPPEITNSSLIASDGTIFYNHSSLSNYNDSNCKLCHALIGSYLSSSMNYSHSLKEGSFGGVNCTSCHDIGAPAHRDVDITGMNSGVHGNLNNLSQYTGGNITNRKCWACHGTLNSNGYANESDQPIEEHNPTKYINPRKCPDCHNNLQSTSNFSAAQVVEHQSAASDVKTTGVKCSICHNNSLTSINENDGFGIYGGDPYNASVSHYATKTSLISTKDCNLCHKGLYTDDTNWGSPVNISTSSKRSHTETLTSQCDKCHNDGNVTSLAFVDFHNASVNRASTTDCINCHDQSTGSGGIYAAINVSKFGKHDNVNKTGGNYTLTTDDCVTCHYNFNFTVMNQSGFTTPTRVCTDCHTSGSYNATIISNHRPGAVNINTTAYCSSCHNNSVNMYNFSQNASVGHYGTNTSLVKPTAGTYNTACNICHNNASNKILYGVQDKQVTLGHTSTATCDECHVNSTGTADTLHNISLEMPLTNNCRTCHTVYADKYGAPNLNGLTKAGWSTCNGGSCHTTLISDSLDTLGRHNLNLTYPGGKGGSTGTVSLDPYVVTKGAFVNITSSVNDTYSGSIASKVGGAEYYIDIDPGQGKGIPMAAADGIYNAINGAFENVVATLDTSNLPGGNHTIFVRGMDIGKQWSAPKNATLIVQSLGYINISSNVPGSIVFINGYSNTTDSNGNYLWGINYGIYTIKVSKDPAYYANTSTGIIVTTNNITNHSVVLDLKPYGTIGGTVRNG